MLKCWMLVAPLSGSDAVTASEMHRGEQAPPQSLLTSDDVVEVDEVGGCKEGPGNAQSCFASLAMRSS